MVDTMAGQTFWIAEDGAGNPEPQPNDLDQAGYEALTWLQVTQVGSIGEMGTTPNILSYDALDTDVTQKQKGIDDAGDPVVECARDADDPGQKAMRAAGETKSYYAFKLEKTDDPGGTGSSPSIYYNRGVVGGPTRPQGRNEDFDIENYTLGLTQKEVYVAPVTGT